MTEKILDSKTVLKRITDYGPKPKSVIKALQQAHAFLCEEGVWITDWFEDGDPKEAFETGMCSSVQACSMSALGFVTGEGTVKVHKTFRYGHGEEYWFEPTDDYDEAYTPISVKAAVALAEKIYEKSESHLLGWDEDDAPIDPAEAVELVIQTNDTGNRTRVLDHFAAAIRARGAEPLIDHTRTPLSIKRQLAALKRKVKEGKKK